MDAAVHPLSEEARQPLWGPLWERYREDRPRKMLTLDGGGIRGMITLEILAKIESLLATRTGRGSEFRLCEYFDYFGGTSTGAIIAAGLARGMSARELLEFYKVSGAAMFEKAALLDRLSHLYKRDPLAAKLQEVFGEYSTLEPQHLRSLLLIVTRNVTTDSPWPISSNPMAKYNAPTRKDCNLRIPLWKLVRASTAAPIFFPPEVVSWDESDPKKTFVFIDGGMTPYNNPAFLLFRMATAEPYGLRWSTGERKLLIVSLGTGSAANEAADVLHPNKNLVSNLAGLPAALMDGAAADQDTNCRIVGRCVHGAPLDREVGDLIPRDAQGVPIPLHQDLGRAFLYVRYDADLSRKGLDALGLSHVKPENVQRLDSVEYLNELSEVGHAVAKKVSLDHFGGFA